MKLINGDCVEAMKLMPDASVNAVVTDPPYELGFMGKSWDASGIAYQVDLWREVLRVLKPGGHLLAFGGARTYHRMACAIEDAGFEVRDSIHWIYGTGFPKSVDVSKAIDKAAGAEREVTRSVIAGIAPGTGNAVGGPKPVVDVCDIPATEAARQWQGWGTALKPAHEPVVVARKPLGGTVAANVQQHGTGALNIDGCRVGVADWGSRPPRTPNAILGNGRGTNVTASAALEGMGRWPPNILLSHTPECVQTGTRTVDRQLREVAPLRDDVTYHPTSLAGRVDGSLGSSRSLGSVPEEIAVYDCHPSCPVAEMDRQSGTRVSHKHEGPTGRRPGSLGNVGNANKGDPFPNGPTYGDSGGASRFFPVFRYQAKASRSERNQGLDGFPESLPLAPNGSPNAIGATRGSKSTPRANIHPTVKPVELMRWLVRLVTPPGGMVLDPFMGSGTTGVACTSEGFDFIGIDREPEYFKIASARIAATKPKEAQAELFA